MIKQNLSDALEICLQALDHGADLESCLALFPDLADDLRPLLAAALEARCVEIMDVPADAARRGKARVLQAAAEMREQSALPVLRRWQNGFLGSRIFRLVTTTAVMLAFLLSGGTGLVSASSSALPGDHLYPVKRSWEGVRLFFDFNPNDRLQLEQEFEQERFQEIEELYTAKRVAKVNFQGQLQTRSNGDWVVGGLNVSINGNATPEAGLVPGVTVQVIGETDNGVIKAEQIILVTTSAAGPTAAPSSTLAPVDKSTSESTKMENTRLPAEPTETEATSQPVKPTQVEDTPQPAKSTQVEDTLQPAKSTQVEDTPQPAKSTQVEDTAQPNEPTQMEDTPQPAKSTEIPAFNPAGTERPAASTSVYGGDSQDGQ